MKRLYLLFFLIITSCSDVQLVDEWRNPEVAVYAPGKALVVGITSNYKARKKFEKTLKNALEKRGAEVITGLEFFGTSEISKSMTEEELMAFEKRLVNEGFDTILLTKVIGVNNIVKYKEEFDKDEKLYKKFSVDYLKHQTLFKDKSYDVAYSVYNAETTMYCICASKDRELIWKGSLEITEPESISGGVKDFIQLMMIALEERNLINPKTNN